MAINIEITSTGGNTLMTSGKYCADNISVQPKLQNKSVIPGEAVQTVTPDAGYAGLGSVEVGAAAPVPEVYAENAKRWTITLEADTSGYNGDLLQDEWLKTHRSDPNLCVAVVPAQPLQRSAKNFKSSILASNTPMIQIPEASAAYNQVTYGAGTRTSSSGMVIGVNFSQYPLTSSSGELNISSNGTLRRLVSDSLPMLAGTYSIIAWLA